MRAPTGAHPWCRQGHGAAGLEGVQLVMLPGPVGMASIAEASIKRCRRQGQRPIRVQMECSIVGGESSCSCFKSGIRKKTGSVTYTDENPDLFVVISEPWCSQSGLTGWARQAVRRPSHVRLPRCSTSERVTERPATQPGGRAMRGSHVDGPSCICSARVRFDL